MLYTRQQATEYLGISDYFLGLLIAKGKIVPANLTEINIAKGKGTRAFAKFTLDEMRRCKKERQEEERLKAEEQKRKDEEAARLREERRQQKKEQEGVPVSLSGVAVMPIPETLQMIRKLDELREGQISLNNKVDDLVQRLSGLLS